MRPQVTSLMLFAVTMLLLARERYVLVPPLFLLWANLHAQVVMGGVLLTVATVIAAFRWVRSRSADDRTRVLWIAGTTVLAAAATLLNPLGAGLWSYVLDANGRPGQQAIAEWHNAFELNPAVLWFWAVLVTAVVASIRRKDRLCGWQAQVAIAAAAAMSPLAIMAVRNIPFFVVAVMPLLMTVLEFQTSRPISRVRHWRGVLITTAAVATTGVIAAWTLVPSALGWRPVSSGLAESVRRCPGHLFNGYDTGAALIWWVPEVKVFVDNRQDPYPAAVIDSLFEITTSNYRTYFARYDVECALLPPEAPLSATLRGDGWERTYSGDDLSLWVAPRATNASE
jgi:hypothetical protein